MTKDSGTTLDHQRSFAQARRRALTRLRNGMDLRWSPAGSRDDLHREFGDHSVDPGSAARSADATRPQVSTGDERGDAAPIHPKNAAGPFYVLNGCCTACGVPTALAPELFAFDSNDHCYVKRQPNSDGEMEKALHVIRGQELDCVRYRGTDGAILRRLAEAGEAHHCDHPPAGVGLVLRNVVTFVISDSHHVSSNASRLLEDFFEYLKGRYPNLKVRTKPTEHRDGEASFALAWFEDHFHPIAIRFVNESGRWLILHRGNLGLSEFLDDWLRSAGRFKDVRWYTENGWERSEGWQSLPW